MKPIVEVCDLSKLYRLGAIGATSLREALGRWLGQSPSAPQQLPPDAGHRAGPEAGTFWALRDVSFDVECGEVVGIIGRNGAGKSTLLKVLSRITEPTAGRAVLRGRVASLLEVGTGFHPELTGRENIFLNGAILGMKRAEIAGKFDEIVAFADVGAFIDTPVKRYSSGMYVRLAFAVVAHLEPEILIIDEVLAVGDGSFQKKCLGKMGEVARSGRTVLFVSHNMPAVQTLCSRAILLDGGRVACAGPTPEVLTHYMGSQSKRGTFWKRPDETGTPSPLRFASATLSLNGAQPRLEIELDLRLVSSGSHRTAFVAVDILNSLGASVMQAVPTVTPFISDANRQHAVRVVIELPPLIPGHYALTLWTGPHNTETLDEAEHCLGFDIESPTQSRIFGHAPDHGYIVPESSVSYAPIQLESRAELVS
jgi:homopolymeric O-antigen transport system ATP-binding protein